MSRLNNICTTEAPENMNFIIRIPKEEQFSKNQLFITDRAPLSASSAS
jgi:hypothetical protein